MFDYTQIFSAFIGTFLAIVMLFILKSINLDTWVRIIKYFFELSICILIAFAFYFWISKGLSSPEFYRAFLKWLINYAHELWRYIIGG